ncbi:MAG: efflux RND transporter permease subunit [Bacteroidetes bacterium]|nr:efflux RND transporter permease subunit [Bacteroidota bacterium]MBL6943246.1 efflux RND transporter permease subunit [Bacteroidales bacterium]
MNDIENNGSKQVIRNFWLSSWALNNKNTVYLIAVVTIIFGFYSYVSLPKELFPEINIPTVMVQTIYPGNPPVDIENLITRPLEKEIESVKGIKDMTSVSSQDASSIFVEFRTDVDIKVALQDVKDAVDKAKDELPDDLTFDPMVEDIDLSEFPVININLSGDFSVNELKDFAEDMKDEFEIIPEVSKVVITGITEKEVKIILDPFKMSTLQVSFGDVENAVMAENISLSGGDMRMGVIKRTIRIIGEFVDPAEIEKIIVKSENGDIVYLRDVGFVDYGFKDRDSYAYLNSQPVVSLQVVKKSGENLLSTISQVMELLDKARTTGLIPENLIVTITNDQSDIVKMQLSNLENSIIMGIIFVVFILFLFLGTRNSLFVGFAIPMSMFMSFMIMGMMDYRINMIVLFSLILALGMLVDNAIVVTENIYRFVDKGYSLLEAAKQATGEVAMPIISSTATTLAAFLPLLFWKSIMGEFMSYMPLTLIIVLSSSLFVALVIIPVVFTDFYKKGENVSLPKLKKSIILMGILIILALVFFTAKINWIGTLLLIFAFIGLLNLLFLSRLAMWFQRVALAWLENFYIKFIQFALKGKVPGLLIIGTFLLMILTMQFYFSGNPKIEFFPSSDPKLINVLAELPISTDIEVSDSVMRVFEEKVFEVLESDMDIVESVLTVTGKGAVGQHESFTGRGGGSNKGLITINFIDFKDRGEKSTAKTLERLSDAMVGLYPGITLSVEKQEEGPPTGRPINLEISGSDFEELLKLTDNIRVEINKANIPGIEALKIDLDVGKPELLVNIDREKVRRYGLSTGQVGDAIRTSLFGKEISDFKDGEDDYKIVMRLDDKFRYNISDIINQRITFRSQSSGKIVQVPISAVADFKYSSTYGAITRKDRNRLITIYSNVLEGYNANEINYELKKVMADYSMPAGSKYKFTGEQEEQAESMAFLAKALLIALALIMIILVSQFNSFVKPAIIMFSVVMSTIGVFGGLATFKMDFVVIMTGVGIVSLAGVVVNNAIVLIDYIGLLKQRKKKELGLAENEFMSPEDAKQCIVVAGKTRLRPVLLTAITTILGLMPLATGFNIDFISFFNTFNPDIYFGGDNAIFWGPMSWTVIFGLSFATFLTLIIVPSLYHVLYTARVRMSKWGSSS